MSYRIDFSSTARAEADAFDLSRPWLYQSPRWNLPPDPEVERRVGKDLTHYLWRGF